MPQCQDARRERLQGQRTGLQRLVEPLQPATYIGQLRCDSLHPPGHLPGHRVNLLRHQQHQLGDRRVVQDPRLDRVHDEHLYFRRVQVPGRAGAGALPLQRATDVVGEPAALGALTDVGLPTHPAAQQATQQERAAYPARPLHRWRALLQGPLDLLEQLPRHQRRPGPRYPHRVRRLGTLGGTTPHGGTGVRFVGQQVVQRIPPPAFAAVGAAAVIQVLAQLLQPVAPQRLLIQLPHQRRGGRVYHQRRPFLRAVAHLDPPVAEGRPRPQKVTSRGRFAHAACDLLGEVLAVELIHALDDGFHQPASGRVVGVLRDGDHLDALAPEHGLEGDRMLPLAGEAGELPDQDDLEGRLGTATGVQHLAELRPVSDAPTLGLVNVLAGDDIAMLGGVVPQRPQLGSDGKVYVLAVTGHAGIQRRWDRVRLVTHRGHLLFRLPRRFAGLGAARSG